MTRFDHSHRVIIRRFFARWSRELVKLKRSTCHVTASLHTLRSHVLYSVSQKIPTGGFWYFTKRFGIFCPNFTRLLNIPIYARLHFFIIFVQLFVTSTKLCHIKRDHPLHITNAQNVLHHRPKRMLGAYLISRFLYSSCLLLRPRHVKTFDWFIDWLKSSRATHNELSSPGVCWRPDGPALLPLSHANGLAALSHFQDNWSSCVRFFSLVHFPLGSARQTKPASSYSF